MNSKSNLYFQFFKSKTILSNYLIFCWKSFKRKPNPTELSLVNNSNIISHVEKNIKLLSIQKEIMVATVFSF